MIPDRNDSVNDSVSEKKNTSFICGVVEGTFFVISVIKCILGLGLLGELKQHICHEQSCSVCTSSPEPSSKSNFGILGHSYSGVTHVVDWRLIFSAD